MNENAFLMWVKAGKPLGADMSSASRAELTAKVKSGYDESRLAREIHDAYTREYGQHKAELAAHEEAMEKERERILAEERRRREAEERERVERERAARMAAEQEEAERRVREAEERRKMEEVARREADMSILLDAKLKEKREKRAAEKARIAEDVKRATFEAQVLGAGAAQVEEKKFYELRQGRERAMVDKQRVGVEEQETYESMKEGLRANDVKNSQARMRAMREMQLAYDEATREETRRDEARQTREWKEKRALVTSVRASEKTLPMRTGRGPAGLVYDTTEGEMKKRSETRDLGERLARMAKGEGGPGTEEANEVAMLA